MSRELAIELHKYLKGKLSVESKVDVLDKKDLSLVYTPGVGFVSQEIAKDKDSVYDYTWKGNTVAVVSDGSAVLGLGDVGPESALPVMEGKALLIKRFAGINAIPICIRTKSWEEVVRIVYSIAPTFGLILLEDIKAPECFRVEETLEKELDIPFFHDDQHGTAIAVLAGLINALKIVGKDKERMKVVVSGAGAAGTAVTYLLLDYGFRNIVVCDSKGIISVDRSDLNEDKFKLAQKTNPEKLSGKLEDAIKGANIFIGLSAPNIVSKEMIKNMASNPVVFAMANPIPEISYEEALSAGAEVVATGRSDYPNQINNLLVFPGLIKGLLRSKKKLNSEIKIRTAKAIAEVVTEEELNRGIIVPSPFNPIIVNKVAEAVM
ncbi:MAG: NADP-dependent malic enzyme [bacterium]|nr:NADP-dependent malic enzyme [bacterium]